MIQIRTTKQTLLLPCFCEYENTDCQNFWTRKCLPSFIFTH